MSVPDASTVPPVLGELEREVMEEIWREGEATGRAVLCTLNEASGRERAYTTVMTVMGNLHRRGCSRGAGRAGPSCTHLSVLDRDGYTDARARAEVGALVAQWGDVAHAHFARAMAQLDPERRQRLPRVAGHE